MLVIVFFLHLYFIRGLAQAHQADRQIIYFIRAEMMKLLKIEFPPKLKRLLDQRAVTMPDVLNWSYLPQLMTTGILISVAIICLFR